VLLAQTLQLVMSHAGTGNHKHAQSSKIIVTGIKKRMSAAINIGMSAAINNRMSAAINNSVY